MTSISNATLARLDTDVLGSNASPSSDGGDDRAGRYWKVTDSKIVVAAKVALITGRPLLLEGMSGVGKSSLARALAESLGWAYYETVITSQTELAALTGSVDHVWRLHEAEYAARRELAFDSDPERFLVPGVLWWAFDPASAAAISRKSDPGLPPVRTNREEPGAVVLVDEIDKADPDLPNNLLVPFGSMQLDVGPTTYCSAAFFCASSDQEHDMPAPFLRRCVALTLEHPDSDQLIDIARHHVAGDQVDKIAMRLARWFADSRTGQISAAEFIDAVRAAVGLGLDPSGTSVGWSEVQSLFAATLERRRR